MIAAQLKSYEVSKGVIKGLEKLWNRKNHLKSQPAIKRSDIGD
jgi:hypothetical protein